MSTKYPKALGACIDMLYEQRAKRLELSKIVDEAKKQEALLEEHIINSFGKTELAGAKGHVATAAIKTTTTASLDDWDSFISYVEKHKAWELLQKRPAVTAIKERWDEGLEVPGVSSLTKISLSLTKV